MPIQDILIQDYDYPLPQERIAQYPNPERSGSKLLLYRNQEISEYRFRELPELLPKGTLLVRNNSRVIRARLLFRKESGAQVEIFCLDPAQPSSYEQSLQSRTHCSWHCLIGNAKRWKQGALKREVQIDGQAVCLSAHRLEDAHTVSFSWDNPAYTFGELIEAMGILPIPPYLNRETEEADTETYQTVYAQAQGSVAAPTAGLHFTPEVFAQLEQKRIPTLDVTLHVGAGTFRPVKSERIGEHEMHQELVIVSRETIERLLQHPNEIIAIGTTSVRTLESLYHLGAKLLHSGEQAPESLLVEQWQPYQAQDFPSKEEALHALLHYIDNQGTDQLIFPTAILIAPGYKFRLVRGIITNFHQPHSTLLLLISALIGSDWRKVYDYALEHDFRFLSYGDSSLLLP